MFCGRPEFETIFHRREGESVFLEKQGQILPLMGILKTNSSVYYDWKREGGRASNTEKEGAKNSSFDLYGKINKQTKVYYDW